MDGAQRLLRLAARVGVLPRLLLLDRDFSSGAVVRYLQAAQHPFLMPVVRHGRAPNHPKGPSGSSVVCGLMTDPIAHLAAAIEIHTSIEG